jgi:hypothetical protein
MTRPQLEELDFQIPNGGPDWAAAEELLAETFAFGDYQELETELDELLDIGLLDQAANREEEILRQSVEILRADMAKCQELVDNPELSGKISGSPAVSSEGELLRVIGKASPKTAEDYLSPYWRFFRLWTIGALDSAGLTRPY